MVLEHLGRDQEVGRGNPDDRGWRNCFGLCIILLESLDKSYEIDMCMCMFGEWVNFVRLYTQSPWVCMDRGEDGGEWLYW